MREPKTVETMARPEWTPERIASVARNAALVLVGGTALGMFAAAGNLYYVGAVVAAALLIVVVFWQFEAALGVYALVAFVPWGRTPDLAVGGSGVGKGVYVSEVMLGFLLAIWAGKYLLGQLPKDRIKSGFHVPIVLYLAFSVVNVMHSYLFWDPHVSKVHQHLSVNIIELGLRVLSAGAFGMIASSMSNRKWLTWTTVLVCVPGLYNLLNAAIGERIPVAAPWWPLISLLPAGYCWAVALDAGAARVKRAIGAALVALAMFVILYKSISWVSGWFGLAVTLAVITALKSRKLFVVGAVVAAVAVAASWGFFHHEVVVASQEEGDYDRFALLAGGWKYATNFPVGVGIGNYRTYNSFHYGEKWGTTAYTSAHGTYAQHLSEMGIGGTVLFLSILVSGFMWTLRSYREMRSGPSRTYLLAAMGQLAGIGAAAFIGDYIIPTYHNGGLATFSATVYSWLIWGLAVAHVRISKAEANGSIDIDSKLEHTRSS